MASKPNVSENGTTSSNFELPKENLALYVTPDHKIYTAPSPPLNPGPDDCVVHVRANGICGSVHDFKISSQLL